jgi:hypothetical protein
LTSRKKSSVEGDHDIFVGSFQENAIKQRRRQAGNDDVKVIETTDKMQLEIKVAFQNKQHDVESST